MSSRKGLSAKTSSGITRPPALQLQQVAASTSGRNVYTLGSTENLDAGIAAAADAAQQNGANPQRRMVRVQSGINRKVEFHKTKKLRKKASALYMSAMAEVGAGKFNAWSRAELVQLIVSVHKVELRNEERLETVALRDLCESMYQNKPTPKKPDPPTFHQLVFENVMARRIQNCWIVYQATKRLRTEEDQSRRYQAQVQDIAGAATGDIGQAELMYMTMHNEMVVGGAVQEVDVGTTLGETTVDIVSPRSGVKKKKGVNVLDIPWTPPEIEKAKRYADYVQPRKDVKDGVKFKFRTTTTGRHCCLGGLGEQFDLWQEGQVSEFSTYGPGVTNYFKFMKWCFWLFVTLTIIALPALVLNTSGSFEGNTGLKTLAKTTIGNLAVTYANTTMHVPIPGCDNYGIYRVSCTFNADSLALFYAIIDIIISATIFVAFIWLFIFERLEETTLDESTIRASMYTIAVTHLPPDVTEDELYDHFGSFVKTKNPIVGMSLAYDNVAEIKACKRRGDLIRAKVSLVHEHRYKCTEIKKKAGSNEEAALKEIEEERQKFYDKMKKMNTDLKQIEEELAKLAEVPMNVVYAFITFDKSSDREKVLDAYSKVSAYTYLCKNAHLKLRGKYLTVKPAPEPSVIIWENLSFTRWDRNKRKVATTFGALLLIVISLIMVFSSKYLEETATNNGSSQSNLCPESFGDWTKDDQRNFVDDNPSELYCYCDQFSTIGQAADSYCRDYLRKNIQSQVLLYFASMIVLAVNFAIDKAINFSSSYEKHHTSDGKGMSMFMRIFILKFINTAAVFLINNNNVVLQRVFGVEAPSTAEFSSDWYNQIGTTIILVQLGDIFNAHAGHMMKFLRYWRRKTLAHSSPEKFLTQEELNRSLAGPKFEFAGNYAQLLSTFFVCLTFSTGIPLLYPIAAVNFILFYLVEKYQFVHVYKIPPHFNTLVGRRATALVPLAILIHLVMSIWVLSNNALFNTNRDDNSSVVNTSVFGATIAEKITAKATFPLFITFCVLIFMRLMMSFLRAFWQTLMKIYMMFFAFLCAKRAAAYAKKKPKKKSAAKDVVAYTRAVQRNLIKGLSTYNILLNPHYKEAFGITWKFAAENKNVRDVKNIKAKAHAGADEDDAAKADELARNAALQGRQRGGAKKKPMAKNRSFLGSFYGDLNAATSPTAGTPTEGTPTAGGGATGGGGGRGGAGNLERPPSDRNISIPRAGSHDEGDAHRSRAVSGGGEEAKRGSGRHSPVPNGPAPGADGAVSQRGSGRLRVDPNAPSTAGGQTPPPSNRGTPVPAAAAAAVGSRGGTPVGSARGAPPPPVAMAMPAGGSTPVAAAVAYGYPAPHPGAVQRPMSNGSGRASHPASPAHSPRLNDGYRGPVPPAQGDYYAPPPQQQGYHGPAPGRGGVSPGGLSQQQQYQQMQYMQQQQAAYYAAQQAAGRGGAGGQRSPAGSGRHNGPPPQQYYPPQDPRYRQGPGGY